MKRLETVPALLAVTFLSLALFSGCGGPKPASEAGDGAVPSGLTEYMPEAAPEQGDWLLLRLPTEMPHLNPLTSTDYYSGKVLDYIFDGMLIRNPVTLEMEPWVAESYEVSEDHLVYTFHLRKDVVFSDGAPLTAQDVKFTFDRLKDPAVDAPHLRNYIADITSVEVVDDYTVRFTCDKPYYLHAVVIGGMYIIPKHIYGVGDFNNHPNNRAPVGSGLYVLESWATGREVVLSRNTRFWGAAEKGLPHFDKIKFIAITDDNAAFQVLARGDMDAMRLLPEDWVRRANTPKFTERFNRFTTGRPAFNYIGWNTRKPQFSDRETRRALAMLMNRNQIITEIYQGLAMPVVAGFMPGTPENNGSLVPISFDPAGAAALLGQAGWLDSNGDGTLDRDGTEFRFDAFITNQNPVAEKILTLYKEELARAGIELVIRPMEWASLLDRVDKRDFDVILMAWMMTPDPDPYQIWHSSQAEKGSNYVGFVNEEADRLVEAARVSFDRNERIRLYHRFQEILYGEQPYLFMMAPKELMAVDKRIQGIRGHLFGMEEREWFAPRALQRYGG
ncbi:MAG: hypothetical protein GX580_04355 [Candidatus Hydrogenedens sp.]|nr:hypothetical protein [Candidatus Hydrogenedentota bacterium]NLF56851.1 hypothetical protein [Candidatus Hydrogenedens sp.]